MAGLQDADKLAQIDPSMTIRPGGCRRSGFLVIFTAGVTVLGVLRGWDTVQMGSFSPQERCLEPLQVGAGPPCSSGSAGTRGRDEEAAGSRLAAEQAERAAPRSDGR